MQLISIQYLRAVAVLLVVFHHFVQINLGFKPSNALELFFKDFGALGVDLFFVISGFVITLSAVNKEESIQTFLKRRLLRIAPAYWFYTLLLACLVLGLEGFYKYDSVEMLFLFKSLFFIPVTSPVFQGFFPFLTVGWTLNYEMNFYLLFAVSLGLCVKLECRVTVLLVLLSLMVFLANKIPSLSFYASFLVYEFFWGVLAAYAYLKGWLPIRNTYVSVVLLLIAMIYLYMGHAGHHYLFTGVPMVAIVIAAVSLEKYARSGFFSRLGDYSYSIYLSHAIVWFAMKELGEQWVMSPYIMFIPGLLLIYGLSSASFSWIEQKLYFNLKDRGVI